MLEVSSERKRASSFKCLKCWKYVSTTQEQLDRVRPSIHHIRKARERLQRLHGESLLGSMDPANVIVADFASEIFILWYL
jgi:hypothetical protein